MRSLALLFGLVVPFLLLETWQSRRHEVRLRSRGAFEPPEDVYQAMQVVYPGMFLAMAAEGVLRDAPVSWVTVTGIAIFLVSKALKWWVIVSLGELWSFRVLVVPGVALVTTGPYRFARHPNYVALALEVIGAALMWNALWTGPLAAVAFGELVRRRILVEERALGLRTVTPRVEDARRRLE
jgi:methyltransferase